MWKNSVILLSSFVFILGAFVFTYSFGEHYNHYDNGFLAFGMLSITMLITVVSYIISFILSLFFMGESNKIKNYFKALGILISANIVSTVLVFICFEALVGMPYTSKNASMVLPSIVVFIFYIVPIYISSSYIKKGKWE